MALIAWYPLSGDMLDYSGNDNHATNRGATPSTQGKIGETYSFNGSSNYITSDNILEEKKDFSIGFWAKTNSTATQCFGSSRTAVGAGFSIFILNRKIRFDTGSSYQWTTPYTMPLNQWVHIVLTKDDVYKKLYINGELFASTTSVGNLVTLHSLYTIGASHVNGTGIGNYLNGFLNDYRIYDHALSEKEVKEISKAKILHYTFDDFQEPTENLWNTGLTIYNNYRVPATLTRLDETYLGQPVYRLGMTVDDTNASRLSHFQSSLSSHGIFGGRMTFKANTKYSASILWRPVNKSDVFVGGTASNISGWTALPSEKLEDGWYRHTQVRNGLVSVDMTDNVFHSFRSPSLKLNETVYIDFCSPQIEEGKDYATPPTLNARGGVIKDMSGYGNDASLGLSTTPKWTKDSKIGSGAYEFNVGKLNRIVLPSGVSYKMENATYSVWFFNENKGDARHSILRNFFEVSGQQLQYWSYDLSQTYWRSTGNVIPYNQWSHLAMTWDGSRVRLYVNGKKEYEQPSPCTGTTEALTSIGGYSGRELANKIDDVRIYAIALSDEDVKELYQARASLDNEGKVYVEKLNERPNLAFKLNDAVKNKTFTDGLSSYAQSNCRVTLTDSGYRIYRPPNLTVSANGNTMWGGLRLRLFDIDPNILKKGHKYRISFDVTGKSSNSAGNMYFSNQMGWAGGGLTSVSATNAKTIPSNFQGSQEVSAEFNITDDIWKVCTSSYSSFVAGQSYNCYRDLAWGFQYTNTGTLGTDLYLTNFQVVDITESSGYNLSNKGILTSNGISEIGLPVRYIRDSINGSTSNTSNHWVEIQAIDKHDVNVALGKSATSALLIDGSTATSPYYSAGTGSRSVEVDLGRVHTIYFVKVWHYYGDRRTYHKTKTEVSADGVNWITIFDSSVEGEYQETAEGHTIICKPNKMSISSNGTLYARQFKEIVI